MYCLRILGLNRFIIKPIGINPGNSLQFTTYPKAIGFAIDQIIQAESPSPEIKIVITVMGETTIIEKSLSSPS